MDALKSPLIRLFMLQAKPSGALVCGLHRIYRYYAGGRLTAKRTISVFSVGIGLLRVMRHTFLAG